jgi:hypothetical protein
MTMLEEEPAKLIILVAVAKRVRCARLEVSGSSAEPGMPPTCNLDELSSFLR